MGRGGLQKQGRALEGCFQPRSLSLGHRLNYRNQLSQTATVTAASSSVGLSCHLNSRALCGA